MYVQLDLQRTSYCFGYGSPWSLAGLIHAPGRGHPSSPLAGGLQPVACRPPSSSTSSGEGVRPRRQVSTMGVGKHHQQIRTFLCHAWLSPSAASRLARLRTPRLADRQVHTQAVLPQPSGSCFQTRWFLHLPLRCRHKTVPETFSYPARRFLHARDQRRHHRCHRRGTRLVNGHRHRGWTSDLFSSRPRPELGGSPVDTCVHPWRRSDQLGVLHQPCTASVYKLLCNSQ